MTSDQSRQRAESLLDSLEWAGLPGEQVVVLVTTESGEWVGVASTEAPDRTAAIVKAAGRRGAP